MGRSTSRVAVAYSAASRPEVHWQTVVAANPNPVSSPYPSGCPCVAMKLEFSDHGGPMGLFVAGGRETLSLGSAAGVTAFAPTRQSWRSEMPPLLATRPLHTPVELIHDLLVDIKSQIQGNNDQFAILLHVAKPLG